MSKSREFFYEDETGKQQDAALHEPILDNPVADEKGRRRSIQAMRAQGFTEEVIRSLFAE
jgi:hypothetical protein